MKIEFDDNYFMGKAIDEAKIALSKGEVPVGAVIVADNKIIARAHNIKLVRVCPIPRSNKA